MKTLKGCTGAQHDAIIVQRNPGGGHAGMIAAVYLPSRTDCR